MSDRPDPSGDIAGGSAVDAPGGASRGDPRQRILIIEDMVDLAMILQRILEKMGFEVHHAADGQQALAAFRDHRPDLVLLDIALPDITGWRLLEEMRAGSDDGAGPVVLVVTAYGDPANRLMGKLQGVQGYLIKPFTVEDVGRAVTSVLRLEA